MRRGAARRGAVRRGAVRCGQGSPLAVGESDLQCLENLLFIKDPVRHNSRVRHAHEPINLLIRHLWVVVWVVVWVWVWVWDQLARRPSQRRICTGAAPRRRTQQLTRSSPTSSVPSMVCMISLISTLFIFPSPSLSNFASMPSRRSAETGPKDGRRLGWEASRLVAGWCDGWGWGAVGRGPVATKRDRDRGSRRLTQLSLCFSQLFSPRTADSALPVLCGARRGSWGWGGRVIGQFGALSHACRPPALSRWTVRPWGFAWSPRPLQRQSQSQASTIIARAACAARIRRRPRRIGCATAAWPPHRRVPAPSGLPRHDDARSQVDHFLMVAHEPLTICGSERHRRRAPTSPSRVSAALRSGRGVSQEAAFWA